MKQTQEVCVGEFWFNTPSNIFLRQYKCFSFLRLWNICAAHKSLLKSKRNIFDIFQADKIQLLEDPG